MVLKDRTSAPCRDCKDRWINETGRCHTECERYKAFKEEVKRNNEVEAFERSRTYRDPLMEIKSIAKKNRLKKERKR